MKSYDHKKIERYWRAYWEKKKIFQARKSGGKKFYPLVEFPYPSGAGMHVGHIRSYTAMDIIARKRRMEGHNVLYPIGWDAFGLPTENYAVKTGKKPSVVTRKNTDTFRRQLQSLGFSFDWSREINTTDPKYYRWTQWIFLQLFKKGLAYKAKSYINWCLSCKIGLANEEVVDGKCERCGGETEKREKEQWMLAITKYAERLHKDLDLVDYPERVKIQQRNWIGRSEGAEIEFKVIASPDVFDQVLGSPRRKPAPSGLEARPDHSQRHTGEALAKIKVFTTRADTLFGATYLVLAPEHELVSKLRSQIYNWSEVEKYVAVVKKKTEMERMTEGKEKTGVELGGIRAVNPASGEEIPVWIADYVLPEYGTGAIMAVPAHDERDFAFAKRYGLPIREVIAQETGQKRKNEFFKDGGVGVVFDPETQLYAVEEWRDDGRLGFFAGEKKDGETAHEAVLRGVREESGLFDFKHTEKVKVCYAHYYNKARKENRSIRAECALVILNSRRQTALQLEDHEKFEVVWLSAGEILKKFTDRNVDGGYDHYIIFLKSGVGRAIELGFDKTSDPTIFHVSPFEDEGILDGSKSFDGLTSREARKKITEFVGGKIVTKFKLRDWVFSRQRYWGEPIPLIYCANCARRKSRTSASLQESDFCGVAGWVPVPEKDLPVKLPEVRKYTPTDTGESPLAKVSKWVNVKCPKCKGPARRETDTMPNWAGSSWYYLRYADPKNNKEFASKKNLKYWLGSRKKSACNTGGVDWYNGGMEHTTLHLLYSRFWHKFLYDLKLVPTPEPYAKRTSHGMILGEGGVKMSKSLGNVVNPDDIVRIYGADTLRVYEMFMGPFEDAVAWSSESIIGARRFIEKVWRTGQKVVASLRRGDFLGPRVAHAKVFEGNGLSQTLENCHAATTLEKLLHKTIKKVSEDIESMRFNTAVSAMMVLGNKMESIFASPDAFVEVLDSPRQNSATTGLEARPDHPRKHAGSATIDDFKKFLRILAPFAPFMAEEIWRLLGEKKSIHLAEWPKWDERLIKDEEVKIVIQVNGKVRSEILIPSGAREVEVKARALADETVLKFTSGREPRRVVYVPDRLVNIVV